MFSVRGAGVALLEAGRMPACKRPRAARSGRLRFFATSPSSRISLRQRRFAGPGGFGGLCGDDRPRDQARCPLSDRLSRESHPLRFGSRDGVIRTFGREPVSVPPNAKARVAGRVRRGNRRRFYETIAARVFRGARRRQTCRAGVSWRRCRRSRIASKSMGISRCKQRIWIACAIRSTGNRRAAKRRTGRATRTSRRRRHGRQRIALQGIGQ